MTISDAALERIVHRALAEDMGSGDVTSRAIVPKGALAEGTFLVKAHGVVAGTPVVSKVFEVLDPSITVDWHVVDGETVSEGQRIGIVSGQAEAILTGERTALNVMQRMSGIASATRKMVEAIKPHRTRILDTRKTAPGLRLLDKLAVMYGGGTNHRAGLYDMVLIKDNHISIAGDVSGALTRARQYLDENDLVLEVEIEARTLAEVSKIVEHWEDTGDPDRILLDNMVDVDSAGNVDTSRLRQALELIGSRMVTEASGNVGLGTIRPIAETGVDSISSGALTHSAKALDISLEFNLVGA